MDHSKIEVGTIVLHPARPGWGPGKALIVGGGGQVTVYFRDIEENMTGDAVKTLATNVVGLEIAEEQSDSMLDSLPPFTKGRFEGVRKPRLSMDQAVQAFIDVHPGAFEGPVYVEKTREPILAAHRLWAESLGDERGSGMMDRGEIDTARRAVLEISDKAGLLNAVEGGAFAGALDDPDSAEPFLRALFDVVDHGAPDQERFQRLIETVVTLEEQEGEPHVSTWPVLTQLPFIGSPEHHLYVRPAILQKCASRLNFDLRCTAGLDWWTYKRMLRMGKILFDRLEPLGAKDLIDVHSMIRVIAAA